MTPVFTREDQNKFFNSLPLRMDYLIWGVVLDAEEIVGATGLKNHRGTIAEYWGYIGEKKYWNKGFGRELVMAVEKKARDFGFNDLDLKVSATNTRAVSLYRGAGFLIDQERSTESCLYMVKRGI